MDITELEAIEADMEAIGERWGLGQERVHAALREALAEVERLRAGIDDLRAQHAEAFARVAAERDLAQITMAEAAGRRIMDLTAENEQARVAIARVRALCEYVDILDASEYDAGRMAALDAARAALDGEA